MNEAQPEALSAWARRVAKEQKNDMDAYLALMSCADRLDELESKLRDAQAERDALREALKELITWIPSAGTYRRLGFDPEAPMRALETAHEAIKDLLKEK